MSDSFDVYGYLSEESERFRIEQRQKTPDDFAKTKQTVAAALAQFKAIGPGTHSLAFSRAWVSGCDAWRLAKAWFCLSNAAWQLPRRRC